MSSESPSKTLFWKRSSPKMPGGSIKSIDMASLSIPKHKLTFKEFEHHTEDAWDASEDDLLRDAISKINIHPEDAMESAKAVIARHSKGTEKTQGMKSSMKVEYSDSSKTTLPPDRDSLTQRNVSGNTERTTESEDRPNSGNDAILGASNDSAPQDNNNILPHMQSIRAPLRTPDNSRENIRIQKFQDLVNSPSTDLADLRELSWSGVPVCMRPDVWRILCDYMPANRDRRATALKRKRKEYFNFVRDYYDKERQGMHKETFHQIHIDIPRTNPLIPLFQSQIVQRVFERLLFIWAIRHPASGYVQGINDLVTPFFVVFLSEKIGPDADVETYDVSKLQEETLQEMEADTFWCTSKLLDGIQDNYTFAQPGVQTKVQRLRDLNKSVDEELHNHFERHQVEYLQFAFRWMNNLLMREIPLRCTIRLWDTYLAENNGFSDFHLYVCVAFLRQWRKRLLAEADFQGLMLSLQNVPTRHWGSEEINLMLAEAFRLRYTYQDAQSHLASGR